MPLKEPGQDMFIVRRTGIRLLKKKRFRIQVMATELRRHSQRRLHGILWKKRSQNLHWQLYFFGCTLKLGHLANVSQCCPPLVLGPIIHNLQDLDHLNTSVNLSLQVAFMTDILSSNQRIRDIMQGKASSDIPPTGTFLWTDVSNLHVNHRHLLT